MKYIFKIIILSTWLAFSKFNILAQKTIIDSQLVIIKTHFEDTFTVKALNILARELRNNNSDSAMYFAERAKSISEKISYKSGLAEAYLWIGTIYTNWAEYEIAFSNLQKSIKLNPDKKILSTAYGNLGLLYYYTGNYKEAITNQKIALSIRKNINYNYGVANSLNNLALVYKELGNYREAIQYHFLALNKYEQENKLDGVSMSYQNIGNVYFGQNKFEEALFYYTKSIKISEKLNDKNGIAISHNNIAGVYIIIDDTSKALSNYKNCIKIANELNNLHLKANALLGLGKIYAFSKNTKEALNYFFQAIKINEQLNNQKGLALNYGALGEFYRNINDYKNAEKYLLKALVLSLKLETLEITLSLNEQLSEIYKLTKNHKLSLLYYEEYIKCKDSLINENNLKASIKSQLKYEYEKKAAADSVRVAKEKMIVFIQLKQEKIQRFGLYAGLSLVVLFAIFMLNRFLVTNKQKNLIQLQKIIVEQQKNIVDEKQKEILDSIRYAKRIQTALLPNEKYFEKNLKKKKNE